MSSEGDRPRFILASGSPRRRELLCGLGLRPEVRPADIDETQRVGEPAEAYVLRLAEDKARCQIAPGEVVLAADTIVTIDGELLGKPRDEPEARSMLERLSARRHEVLTGVSVCSAWGETSGTSNSAVATTGVWFKALTRNEIDWYITTGEPADKAGAYGIQGKAALFIESIEGNYSNVVGLPLPLVRELLAWAGLDPIAEAIT